MSSITFLFGAGADSLFKLADGANFALSVIGADPTTPYEEILEDYFREKKEKDAWYPKFINRPWKNEDLLKASIRKELLADKSLLSLDNYNEAVDLRFKNICKKPKQSKKQIDNYTSYMGLLDEHFHTLINPKVLGAVKFWRVVMCYARAYCCLTSKMLPREQKQNYELLLKEPSKVLDFMKQYAEKKKTSISNYYEVIKGLKANYSDVKFHVISSNYTTLCQTIAELNDDDIAYVHGKIGWFESARDLRVYDAAHEKLPSDDVLFPYLFIQSGVKPIVDIKQIREFSKAISYLDAPESTLIIVGYCLNSDDNHINSLIRSFLLKDDSNKVIYFSYKEKYDAENIKETLEEVLERLRMKKEDLKSDDQFKVRNIDRENSIEEFKNTLEGVLEAKENAGNK